MSKYDSLDQAILARISPSAPSTTPVKFTSIYAGDVLRECERIAAVEGGAIEPFRVADRRLQALRKAGSIHSTGKGWVRLR